MWSVVACFVRFNQSRSAVGTCHEFGIVAMKKERCSEVATTNDRVPPLTNVEMGLELCVMLSRHRTYPFASVMVSPVTNSVASFISPVT